MNEEKETFETRVARLEGYLTRAYEYNKPSILFALYLSEFQRADVEKSLEKLLKEQGLEIVDIDAGKHKNLPDHLASINSKNIVFFVHNVEKGFPDSLQYLNFKRETIAENHIKVVFWVTETELTRISREAPDFFAFRNRVVEFMEVPLTEERRSAVVDFALETEYKSLDEIKSSIELKEKLLAELSGDDEMSGYLLGSLGVLYDQIGSSEKAIELIERALAIARKIGDKRGEGTNLGNQGMTYIHLGYLEKAIKNYEEALSIDREIGDRKGEATNIGNLGMAYYSLGQIDKAIKYYEQALAITREIRDRRGEGICLGILGIAYGNLDQVEKAIEYCEQALVIAREIKDMYNEGVWLGNLGVIYGNLGKIENARDYYEKAFVITRETGDRRGEGSHLNNLGFALINENKYKEALACYLLARDIRTEIKDPNLKITEDNIKAMKEKLGENKFNEIEKEVVPKAAEIVKKWFINPLAGYLT